MRFFNRSKKKNGVLAMVTVRDQLAFACVTRAEGERPKVLTVAMVDGPASAAVLERAGKELKAQSFHCSAILAGPEYQMISVEKPNVPDAELRTAVRWRLKDVLDFPADQATIDVLDLPIDANAAVRPQATVFVVAARNSVIEPLQKMCAQAKFPLSVIDIPEMAQRNIASLVEVEGRGLAMLSLGDDGGLLTVSFKGELYLSRRIDVSLAQLCHEDHDRKHAAFDRVTLELQRSLDNFERQFAFISVAKLVIGPSLVTGLEEYLASNLYTPVETLDLGAVLDFAAVPELAEKAEQQRYFLALGGALREQGGA